MKNVRKNVVTTNIHGQSKKYKKEILFIKRKTIDTRAVKILIEMLVPVRTSHLQPRGSVGRPWRSVTAMALDNGSLQQILQDYRSLRPLITQSRMCLFRF